MRGWCWGISIQIHGFLLLLILGREIQPVIACGFFSVFWEFPRIEEKQVPWLNSPTGRALWYGRSQICTEPIDSWKS